MDCEAQKAAFSTRCPLPPPPRVGGQAAIAFDVDALGRGGFAQVSLLPRDKRRSALRRRRLAAKDSSGSEYRREGSFSRPP